MSVRPSAGRTEEGNDEAGTLANTIPSGEREREGEQCMQGKAKKICLGRRKTERTGKGEKARERERGREKSFFVQ